MKLRILLAITFTAFAMGSSATVSAADLGLKARVHHSRIHVAARPWCVIENVGTAVWTCARTRAECHAFEVPGTSLYCVRDPIPGRPYAMR
jgi:hypothetical protein